MQELLKPVCPETDEGSEMEERVEEVHAYVECPQNYIESCPSGYQQSCPWMYKSDDTSSGDILF